MDSWTQLGKASCLLVLAANFGELAHLWLFNRVVFSHCFWVFYLMKND